MESSWKDLFQWAKQFRSDNNLTSRQFLELIGLQPRSAFLQYLSSPTREPSRSAGSVGLQIRTAIESAKKSPPEVNVARLRNVSPGTNIMDSFYERKMELACLGIIGLSITSEMPLQVDVAVAEDCKLSEHDIEKILPNVQAVKLTRYQNASVLC